MRPWSTSTERALRRLLNEWDPIGVADDVQDEYDCMLAPLLGRLQQGAGRAEIGAFLTHESRDHFGLDPSLLRPDATAARVIAWWTGGGRTEGATGP
ncbi:hypothetical protein [Streptomyces sp. MJP52]|uniref:hypothetical protein n=1 Tax=Streptomyces sp. MJP52 TaxID=2940555 RepID=UPI0024753352|nr:hypothetical protein [Streptomyces sp. MJP52]MDH6226790.1 hypothetical protein [Streptomyces sp. MJP52]